MNFNIVVFLIADAAPDVRVPMQPVRVPGEAAPGACEVASAAAGGVPGGLEGREAGEAAAAPGEGGAGGQGAPTQPPMQPEPGTGQEDKHLLNKQFIGPKRLIWEVY